MIVAAARRAACRAGEAVARNEKNMVVFCAFRYINTYIASVKQGTVVSSPWQFAAHVGDGQRPMVLVGVCSRRLRRLWRSRRFWLPAGPKNDEADILSVSYQLQRHSAILGTREAFPITLAERG